MSGPAEEPYPSPPASGVSSASGVSASSLDPMLVPDPDKRDLAHRFAPVGSDGNVVSGMTTPVGDVESGFRTPVVTYEAVRSPTPSEIAATSARRAPWAGATDRIESAVLRIPGVARMSALVSRALGPKQYTPPRPPTGLTLTCAMTGGRKTVSSPIDKFCVRITRTLKLNYFYLLYLMIWAGGFVVLIWAGNYNDSAPREIYCTSVMFDDWPPDVCGQNGLACAPTLQDATYRCPGGCSAVGLGNPRWVGDKKVNGKPLVVGGGDNQNTYRADSWLCAAGIHAGVISSTYGGCLRVRTLPYPHGSSNFTGSKSRGIDSVSFEPSYPGAFTLDSAGSLAQCIDYHWPVTTYNVVALFVFTALFDPPPAVLTATILVMGYLQIMLESDPPYMPPNWSKVFEGVPAVLLAGFWAWHVCFRRALGGFRAAGLPVETAIWQGFGLWVGLESSTLFAKIPISRLGYGKLGADGIAALVVIIVIIVFVVFLQFLEFRRCGLVRYYLIRYLPLVPILIILANLGHSYYLRLHHYLLSLAGMPVMSLPNRISLFGQAFFLGFFLDGVGRWGWASIVQGGEELLGDAASGTAIPMLDTILGPMGGVTWPAINASLIAEGIRSVAILFDDILINPNSTVSSFTIADGTADRSVDHYFRVAYMGNGTSLDYTDPVTWYASNQSWAVVDKDT